MFETHHIGDCLAVLKTVPADSVNLIVTSPPYADARKGRYDGVAPQDYAAWFVERAEEFRRVLKDDGTLIVNIKEGTRNGERLTYVLETILAMRAAGWLWTEEWMWHKKNSFPGKWPNRFRDSWERVLQFNLNRKFAMYQDAVKVPMGDWADTRLANLGANDTARDNSRTKSGFGKNMSNWVGKSTVYPSNVLHLPTECRNKGHAAAFPRALPEFFVKLFTVEGDTVLDPFEGSRTTGDAAVPLGRNYIGIDMKDWTV